MAYRSRSQRRARFSRSEILLEPRLWTRTHLAHIHCRVQHSPGKLSAPPLSPAETAAVLDPAPIKHRFGDKEVEDINYPGRYLEHALAGTSDPTYVAESAAPRKHVVQVGSKTVYIVRESQFLAEYNQFNLPSLDFTSSTPVYHS